ncbi:class I adenylate-forming enzyme family protein [Streptomyces sp. NPDC006864]|uniref:class I adenylate-forming enzyme family protein n=1 Tax=Streptomyces sp. NPDC006864 TaxID=3154780 RepID=UPI00345451B7
MLSYSALLARLADERPGEVAVTQLARAAAAYTVTWESLWRAADAGAGWLVESGIRPGELVLNLLGNTWEAIAGNFAIWRAGGCPLPLDPQAAPEALQRIVGLTGATVALASAPVLGLRVGTAEVLSPGRGRSTRLPKDLTPPRRKAIATSGTTRSPRVVVHQGPAEFGEAPTAVLDTVYGSLGLRNGQRQLVVAALSHNMGFDLAHVGLLAGHRLVLAPAMRGEDLFELVHGHRIEYVGVPPIFMQQAVDLLPERAGELASLEAVKHSGSACPVPVKTAWLSALGPERVFEAYGMTEGYGRTVISGREWLERPGSVGRPWKSEVSVVGESGPLPPGELGRIAFRDLSGGRSVVLGEDIPAVGSEVWHGSGQGWHETDDLGRTDDRGYLYLNGRATETVNVFGLQVSLLEVESVLRKHPEVADCLVGLGPAGQLAALVVPTVPKTVRLAARLRSYCRTGLHPHEVPVSFREVVAIPRNAAWKPDRKLAAALLD